MKVSVYGGNNNIRDDNSTLEFALELRKITEILRVAPIDISPCI